MRTISDELGRGAPVINEETGERRARGRKAVADVQSSRGTFPFRYWRHEDSGEPIRLLDDGPSGEQSVLPPSPPGRGNADWPFLQMAIAGKLGLSEPDNRDAYFAGCRLRALLAAVSGDVMVRELGPEGSGSRFNVFRDLGVTSLPTYRKQVVGLAADVLELDFPLLEAVLIKHWTARMCGETQYSDGASARAAGSAMIRCAMRKLVQFFKKLDAMEARGEFEDIRKTWPLVGGAMWPFDGIPCEWTKARTATAPAASNDNRQASGSMGYCDGEFREMPAVRRAA
jgi:hypothetical protein